MRTKQDDNMIENLIVSKVKLESVLNDLYFTINFMQENYNEGMTSKQRAEALNKIEAVLAESEYRWDNRYEKGA